METVELRCPVGPRRLFSKLRLAGQEPTFTVDNLIEFACTDCRKELRSRGVEASFVLHRYNFVGELIETVRIP